MSNFIPTKWDDILTAAVSGPVGYAVGGGNDPGSKDTVIALPTPDPTAAEKAKNEATLAALERIEADKERKRKAGGTTVSGTAAGVLSSAPVERKEILG